MKEKTRVGHSDWIYAVAILLLVSRTGMAGTLQLPASKPAPAPAQPATGTPGETAETPAGTPATTETSPNSTLGSASLSVTDQLDLVTTNIFSGGIGIFSVSPNVFISTTLAATKPATGTATKYQDVELLLPQGGVLNLLVSYSPVNYSNQQDLAKSVKADSVGRETLSDRIYVNGLSPAAMQKIVNEPAAEVYISNGIGVRMLNRNGGSIPAQTASGSNGGSPTSNTNSASNSSSVSNYGVSGIAYVGVGVDGAFIPIKGSDGPGGNYRLEANIEASWTDSTTMKALYQNVPGLKQGNYGVGLNFQAVITSKLGININAGWPFGGAKQYMGRMLLAGITVSR